MVKTNPLVSIGIPVYNRLPQTRRAIECILNQTYKNLEIIISNDCSPNPEMYTMLDEYAAKDKRIKLTHQPVDLEIYGNYHFVQAEATGKYFMYGQDDDWWSPDCIELLVNDLESHPDQMVSMPTSKFMEESGAEWATFKFNDMNIVRFIYGEKCPFIWMGMWKTDLLRQFDYSDKEEPGKDIIISAEALLSYPIGYVEKAVYYKTIYHGKAQKYIKDKPFCHFTMYGIMLYRIAISKHAKRKYLLLILAPMSLVAIVRLYSAYLLFKLPLNHPVRRTVRKVVGIFK